MIELLIGFSGFLLGGGTTYLILTTIINKKTKIPEVLPKPRDFIFQKTNQLMIIFNNEYKLVDYNDAAKNYFVITEANENYSLNSINSTLFNAIKSNPLQTTTKSSVEFTKKISTDYFLLEQQPIKVEGDATDYYCLTLTDHNSIMKALNQLKALKKAAEASIDEKSMFLANMSHELRTPLNAIIGMSELMIETELNESQNDLINSINQSANILYDIINTILDFSKLEANQMGLEEAPIDVIKIVKEIETIFTHEAKVKNIGFKVSVDSDIPPVLGDQVRLRQIIVNLVGNAIKFTHIGYVSLSATLTRKYQNTAEIQFTVSDTGIGFNDDTKSKIFKPFVQEDDSITRQFGGTGLGLPICKSLIEMHKSELFIKSAVGEGSTFSFSISFKLREQETNDQGQKPLSPDSDNRTGKILVAEDNKTNQKLLKMQLQKYKYDVSIVDNGQEVVEEYFENEYDLIIMDCQMPIMDGYCATLIIRQQEELFGKHVPIIALTASALKEDKEKCIQTGMDDYITKPVKIETLHQTIQTWLNKQ